MVKLAGALIGGLKFHKLRKNFSRKEKLSARFEARLQYWWDPSAPPEVRAVGSLLNKSTMHQYIQSLDIKLPQLYFDVSSLDEIDFAALPSAVVIKPANGSNSDGVMLIKGETEHLRGVSIPRSKLRDFCQQVIDSAPRPANRILFEEFLQDWDPRFIIPRDFKVYVAGGRAWVIQVIDRNGSKEQRNHSFYTREWAKIDDLFQSGYRPGPATARPPLLPELLKLAELIARDIGAFLRLDFYLTSRGVVFGEFTFDPFAGFGFTPYGEKFLSDLMDRFPDAIPGGWSCDSRHRLTKAAQLAN
jgi:TupA-like ATPgrasp